RQLLLRLALAPVLGLEQDAQILLAERPRLGLDRLGHVAAILVQEGDLAGDIRAGARDALDAETAVAAAKQPVAPILVALRIDDARAGPVGVRLRRRADLAARA